MKKMFVFLLTSTFFIGQALSQINENSRYSIISLENINTEKNEYSPLVIDTRLIFVTENPTKKSVFHVVEAEDNYANIKETIIKGEFQTNFDQKKLLPARINTFYNEGSAAFRKVDSTLFYTQSKKSAYSKEKGLLKLMQTQLKNEKWRIPVELSFVNSAYNYAHPAWCAEMNRLYFSSDMPGGYGKMDIWYSDFKDSIWSDPINVGPVVNTFNNEVFPTVYQNSLFFSVNSEGGDLNIYKTKISEGFAEKILLPTPINSEGDDFGISFYSNRWAYFSSDREGGLGGDDIYALKITDTTLVHQKIFALFKNFDPALSGKTIQMVDAQGNVIEESVVNRKGEFTLNEIVAGESMKIKFQDSLSLNSSMVLILSNDDGEVLEEVNVNRFGQFVFELLTPDDYDTLEFIESEDVGFLNIDIVGKIVPDESQENKNGITIYIEDSEGNLLRKTETDSEGNFIIKELKPGESYFIKSNSKGNIGQIHIFNKAGEIVRTLQQQDDGKFTYIRFSDEENILSLVSSKNEPIVISEQDEFQLTAIYYEVDEFKPVEDSFAELDKLAQILLNNIHIAVEVSSHTDSQGDEIYNQKLSQRRADFVQTYLREMGISKSKVFAVGYGENRPIITCNPPHGCNENDHTLNRRTEVKIKQVAQ